MATANGVDPKPERSPTDIAQAAAALSDVHRDPADRFIIATALVTGSRLLTLDTTIRAYPEVAHRLS